MRAVGVPCASINDFADLMADPHLAERGMVTEWQRGGGKMPVRLPPPVLGQHSAAILQEFGFTRSEIGQFVTARVVAT